MLKKLLLLKLFHLIFNLTFNSSEKSVDVSGFIPFFLNRFEYLTFSCVNGMVQRCLKTDLYHPDKSVVHSRTCYIPVKSDLLEVMHVAAWLLLTASVIMVRFFFSVCINIHSSTDSHSILFINID